MENRDPGPSTPGPFFCHPVPDVVKDLQVRPCPWVFVSSSNATELKQAGRDAGWLSLKAAGHQPPPPPATFPASPRLAVSLLQRGHPTWVLSTLSGRQGFTEHKASTVKYFQGKPGYLSCPWFWRRHFETPHPRVGSTYGQQGVRPGEWPRHSPAGV